MITITSGTKLPSWKMFELNDMADESEEKLVVLPSEGDKPSIPAQKILQAEPLDELPTELLLNVKRLLAQLREREREMEEVTV